MTVTQKTSPAKSAFLISRSQLRGRLDAEFNFALLTTRIESKYEQRAIREISSSRSGGTPSKSNLGYWDGNIPWASPKDFGSFYLEDTEDHITEAAVLDSSTSVVPADALLMVVRSGVLQHTLPVAMAKRPMAINQDVKAFFFDEQIIPEYAGIYFAVFGKRLLPLITKSGATVQSINTEQFDQLTIPILPHSLQQEIIKQFKAAIEKNREGEAKVLELLASVDELLLAELGITPKPAPPSGVKHRIFRRAFSAVTGKRFDPHFHYPAFKQLNDELRIKSHARLGDVACLSHELWDQKEFFADTFPYIEIGAVDMQFGQILEPTQTLVSEAPSRAQMLVREGDLLVSLTRPTRQAIAFAPQNPSLAVASNGFAVLREIDKAKTSPQFLFHVLRSCLCTPQFSQRSSGGSYPAISEEQLLELIIPLPDPKQQEQIVARLEKVRTAAHALRRRAAAELSAAKKEIEAMILGG